MGIENRSSIDQLDRWRLVTAALSMLILLHGLIREVSGFDDGRISTEGNSQPSFTAVMFLFKFWRRTRDILFLALGCAFTIEGFRPGLLILRRACRTPSTDWISTNAAISFANLHSPKSPILRRVAIQRRFSLGSLARARQTSGDFLACSWRTRPRAVQGYHREGKQVQ